MLLSDWPAWKWVHSEMSLLEPTSCDMKDAEELLHAVTLRMSGGDPLDSYLDYFKAQGQSQCTNVWSKGIIAYRCRTCQTNDSRCVFIKPFPLPAYVVLFFFY